MALRIRGLVFGHLLHVSYDGHFEDLHIHVLHMNSSYLFHAQVIQGFGVSFHTKGRTTLQLLNPGQRHRSSRLLEQHFRGGTQLFVGTHFVGFSKHHGQVQLFVGRRSNGYDYMAAGIGRYPANGLF